MLQLVQIAIAYEDALFVAMKVERINVRRKRRFHKIQKPGSKKKDVQIF